MLYSKVNIEPLGDEWVAYFSDINGDREPNHECLSGHGFYHYHRERGQKAAFDELKAYMIKRHQEEIDDLTKSMNKLQELEY